MENEETVSATPVEEVVAEVAVEESTEGELVS